MKYLLDGKLWGALVAFLGSISLVLDEPWKTLLVATLTFAGTVGSVFGRAHRGKGLRERAGDHPVSNPPRRRASDK